MLHECGTPPGSPRQVHKLPGMSLRTLRLHPSLLPLYFFGCLAPGLGALLLIRTALKHPEVSWTRKDGGRPFDKYRDKQYKLYAEALDYHHLPPSEKPPQLD